MLIFLKISLNETVRYYDSYRVVLYIPEVSVKNGRSFLSYVQYHVENVLASIMSDTPLMKNIVQKKPSKLATVIRILN